MVVVQLREPLPGCAAPSRIGESNLSRRSWRSGGAAAAADSARLGHLSSLSLTQTSLLQLSSIAIGLTQRAGTSGERRAHWLRGAGRSCSDYHISASSLPSATDRSASPRERIRAPGATCSGLRPLSPAARAARLLWLLASLSSSSCPLPRSFPAAPPAPSPPVALLLRPALLGSPLSGWPCCARGSLFCRRWRVAVLLGDGLLTMNQENLRSNFREKGKGSSLCTIGNRQFSSAPEFCVEPRLQPKWKNRTESTPHCPNSC
nr:PREDICTED: uncharacterized protein LOC103551842 [Equus przewalskii]